MHQDQEFKQGLTYAILAYTFWGLAPLYFKQLSALPALEILLHRIVWSFVFISVLLLFRNGYQRVRQLLKTPKTLRMLMATSMLIGCNWFLFIWAVTNDHMLEASLGYFINPLLYVVLGLIFFQERLRKLQWLALAVAASGVSLAVISYGHMPWVAIALATTFGFYGTLRKKIQVEALTGLFVETMLILPLAIVYYIFYIHSPSSNLLLNSAHLNLLLVAAGVVTTLPLLAFSAAAIRIPLSVLGFTQYLGPSIMFLLALFVYHEPFSSAKAMNFAFIWAALLIFTVDGIISTTRRKRAAEQLTIPE